VIFLTATEPNVYVKVYGADHILSPIKYPEINVSDILVVEGALGRRILERNNGKLNKIVFDTHLLPGFPLALPPWDQVPADCKIVLIRGGGIGDVLMLTPGLRELRNRIPPSASITLATFKMNAPLFFSNPHIDAVIAQPLTLGDLMRFDYYKEFNDHEDLMSRIPMIDFYLCSMGIDPSEVDDKRPTLVLDNLYHSDISGLVKKIGAAFRASVYLNGLASDRLRDLPLHILKIFPEKFPDTLFIVPKAYFHRYQRIAQELFDVTNVFLLDTNESLSAYITALTCCDVVVTTDSSAYHLAAALDKPCLALFGPISKNLRTNYYPTVFSIESCYSGFTCKSPCGKSMVSEFYSDKKIKKEKCPEASVKKKDFSPCLESFSSDHLLEAFGQLL